MNRVESVNRYEPIVPRAAFGVAAVAMTVLTFGLLVAAPAHVASGKPEAGTILAQPVAAPVEVAIDPARIDVVTQRDGRTALGLLRRPPAGKDAAS